MISYGEAQELHECIGLGVEQVGDWREALDRALEIASVIVSDLEPEAETEDFPKAYWLGWESEDDFEPGRPDTYFLTICHPDGEEYAVIVHRTFGGQFPLDGDVAKSKEADAQRIVDALNRK
jgi:hypothetical protein